VAPDHRVIRSEQASATPARTDDAARYQCTLRSLRSTAPARGSAWISSTGPLGQAVFTGALLSQPTPACTAAWPRPTASCPDTPAEKRQQP
jgi:hypothetical protein